MSAKTKIVVLHRKELIYTGIFAALGILFVVLMLVMFLPGKEKHPELEQTSGLATSTYVPGVYSTSLILNNHPVEIEVIVTESAISSIRMVNPDADVITMYPLLEPTLETLCEQIYETQSLDNISYSMDNKYTALVLLEAIQNSLDKAQKNNAFNSN